jgi:DNA-binding CsgD family transcriptional regulator
MDPSRNDVPAGNGDRLTAREREVLALLAAGHTTADIAAQLGVAPGTVKTHLTSVYKKIGSKNRVQAARYYLDHFVPQTKTRHDETSPDCP